MAGEQLAVVAFIEHKVAGGPRLVASAAGSDRYKVPVGAPIPTAKAKPVAAKPGAHKTPVAPPPKVGHVGYEPPAGLKPTDPVVFTSFDGSTTFHAPPGSRVFMDQTDPTVFYALTPDNRVIEFDPSHPNGKMKAKKVRKKRAKKKVSGKIINGVFVKGKTVNSVFVPTPKKKRKSRKKKTTTGAVAGTPKSNNVDTTLKPVATVVKKPTVVNRAVAKPVAKPKPVIKPKPVPKPVVKKPVAKPKPITYKPPAFKGPALQPYMKGKSLSPGETMELKNAFDSYLSDLETKIRHVRSDSGVQRFHLPIGSPIVAHPDAPSAPKAKRSRERGTQLQAVGKPNRRGRGNGDMGPVTGGSSRAGTNAPQNAARPAGSQLGEVAGQRLPPSIPRNDYTLPNGKTVQIHDGAIIFDDPANDRYIGQSPDGTLRIYPKTNGFASGLPVRDPARNKEITDSLANLKPVNVASKPKEAGASGVPGSGGTITKAEDLKPGTFVHYQDKNGVDQVGQVGSVRVLAAKPHRVSVQFNRARRQGAYGHGPSETDNKTYFDQGHEVRVFDKQSDARASAESAKVPDKKTGPAEPTLKGDGTVDFSAPDGTLLNAREGSMRIVPNKNNPDQGTVITRDPDGQYHLHNAANPNGRNLTESESDAFYHGLANHAKPGEADTRIFQFGEKLPVSPPKEEPKVAERKPGQASPEVIAQSQRLRDQFAGNFESWDRDMGAGDAIDEDINVMDVVIARQQKEVDTARADRIKGQKNGETQITMDYLQRQEDDAQGVLDILQKRRDGLVEFQKKYQTQDSVSTADLPDSVLSSTQSKEEVLQHLTRPGTPPFQKDSYGVAIPPNQLLDDKDEIQAHGKMMQAEIQAQQDADPNVIAARQKMIRDREIKVFRDQWTSNGSYDNTSGVPIQAQLNAAVRAKFNLGPNDDTSGLQNRTTLKTNKQAIARAELQVKLEYLNSIRPMGPTPDSDPEFGDLQKLQSRDPSYRALGVRSGLDGTQAKWDEMMDNGMQVYPTTWVASAHGSQYERLWSDRAFHQSQGVGQDGTSPFRPNVIALPSRNAQANGDFAYDGGYNDYGSEVAAHEFGHAMEAHVPGVTALEWAEMYSRSGENRSRGNWETINNRNPNMPGEDTREDDWAHPYAGRVYRTAVGDTPHKSHYEILTTGIQDFGAARTSEAMPVSGKRFTHANDDKVEQLILGMMATLHYAPGEGQNNTGKA